MEVYSIGFAKRSAEDFFETLKKHRIERLLDVRLRNASQLAGYTKRDDLPYFLRELVGASYKHEPLLAPLPELLDAYRMRQVNWAEYEERFLILMACRRVEERISPSLFDKRTVLLCSERDPTQCHRRLVLEFLQDSWGEKALRIVHL